MNGIQVDCSVGPSMDLTDGELIQKFVDGVDDGAFAEVVARHGRMVFGVCRRHLGHQHDTEDAVQTVFMSLAHNASKLVGGATVAPWLYMVARQVSLKALKDRRRRRWVFGEELVDKFSEIHSEVEVDLDSALATLPKPEREAVILCHLNGKSRREAAAVLCCREGTLSSRLSRALTRLRRRLGKPPLAVLVAATTVMLPEHERLAAAQLTEQWRDLTFKNLAPRDQVWKGMESMRFTDCLGPAMTGLVAVLLILIGWPSEQRLSSASPPTQAAPAFGAPGNDPTSFTPELFRKLIDAARMSTVGTPIPVDAEVGRILSDWEAKRAGKQSIYAKFDRTIKTPGAAKSAKNSGSLRFSSSNLGRIDFNADASRRGREILLWTAANEFWRFDVDSKTAANFKFERSYLIDFVKQTEFVWLAPADRKSLQKHAAIHKLGEDASQVVLRVLPVKPSDVFTFSSMTVHLRKSDLLPQMMIVQFNGGAEVKWEFTTVLEGIEILESDFAPPRIDLSAWHVTRDKLNDKPVAREAGK